MSRTATKRDQVAEHELGEPLPDLGKGDFAAGLSFDLGTPDRGQDAGPDADEDVDEDLHGRGRAHDPAFLVVHAVHRFRLGPDQGIGHRAGGDRRAVGFHGQSHPCAGHHRLLIEELLRGKGQDQQLHHREDHHQRRDHDRHDRPRLDRRTGGNRRRNAADGNAGGQGRSPFAAELEELPRHKVDQGPIDQVGLDDRAQSAEHHGLRQSPLFHGTHAQAPRPGSQSPS